VVALVKGVTKVAELSRPVGLGLLVADLAAAAVAGQA
jgi:hypothetical protein